MGMQITATTPSERKLVDLWRTCGYKR